MFCEPEIALVPDQPPEAVHDVAFVELQDIVEELPELMEVGFTDSDTVGAIVTAVTLTVAD